jgi:hypothetical protein
MRLFFIDSKFKCVPLEASSSRRRVTVAISSLILRLNSFRFTQSSSEVQAQTRLKRTAGRNAYPGAIHPRHQCRGLSHYPGKNRAKLGDEPIVPGAQTGGTCRPVSRSNQLDSPCWAASAAEMEHARQPDSAQQDRRGRDLPRCGGHARVDSWPLSASGRGEADQNPPLGHSFWDTSLGHAQRVLPAEMSVPFERAHPPARSRAEGDRHSLAPSATMKIRACRAGTWNPRPPGASNYHARQRPSRSSYLR